MRYVRPDYYDAFRCTAGECPDTCCAGWQIVIDEETLEKYKKEKGSFQSRLQGGINWQEGCFAQKQRVCSMLNQDKLCDLILQKGEDWLCETCKRYPRHIEEFEGLREWSLSLSCPVAAELMLNRTEKVEFLIEEDDREDPLESEFEDFDFLLFTQLEDARGVLFSIVQNRRLSLQERFRLIMRMAGEMQLCLDEGRLFDMDEIIRRFAPKASEVSDLSGIFDREKSRQRYENIKEGFGALQSLERLREEWTEILESAERTLYQGDYESYEEIYKSFWEKVLMEENGQWSIFMEQLVLFFLYTYFCGAVYDDCIYSKVGLAVFSACFIQEFVMCRWFLADKHIDERECINLAYRYAREVEHSDENLNTLEEWLLDEMESFQKGMKV